MKFSTGVQCAVLSILMVSSVQATPVNPFPGAFADDDGTEIFTHIGEFFSLELFDFGDSLSLAGNTFGFFFEGTDVTNPANLITIFGPEDVDPDPGGVGSVPQVAGVNINGGFVVDVDASEIQSAFTGSGDVGFFLQVDPLGTSPLTLFSVNAFNPLFADAMGSFPSLTDPDAYLLAFEEPFNGTLVGAFILDNGVFPMPEPGIGSMLFFGVAALLGWRRKSTTKH